MEADRLIVLCTCPNRTVAESIAGALVREAAAACVNIVTGVTSVYVWQDEVHQDEELQLIIKTTSDAYGRVQAIILREHPYELPEIIAVPVVKGLPEYLDWMSSSTQREDR